MDRTVPTSLRPRPGGANAHHDEAHRTSRIVVVTAFPPRKVDAGGPAVCSGWPTRGRRVALPWIALAERLATPFEVPSKESAPTFTASVFAGDRRLLANVEVASCVVLDVDDGARLDETASAFQDIAHVLHTSFSHTPAKHRFRVVLPLNRDVDAGTYRRLWRWASNRIGGKADRQTSDPSRLYYRYCRTPHAEHRVHLDAPLLDVDTVLAAAPPPSTPKPATWMFRGVELPVRRPLPSWRHPDAAVEQRRQEGRLRTDPDARRALARALDARIQQRSAGDVAVQVTCPRCGRPSAWFFLEPRRKTAAECNHREHCGWVGPLHELSPGVSP